MSQKFAIYKVYMGRARVENSIMQYLRVRSLFVKHRRYIERKTNFGRNFSQVKFRIKLIP